ncbi:hypothetical protein [Peribacillus sp. ACCC06369]|uniref:hypothetical protein n=1 Tax=Peribacillus sp. ACCC06369 TaxID=3055860 RepID=UPI0025A0D93E|nr:hypothetical protein [Peribacillus sp. ACCC06369]MDM5359697.1 hypothetical protein [Peribacillus sp. ACCC06369]
MDKLKNLQEIYNANRPENNELFRAIQAHLQLKYPDKRMTATRTLQIIVADSVASGVLLNVESKLLHSS